MPFTRAARNAIQVLLVLVVLAAAGCAAPEPKEIAVIAASRGTISTWNEIQVGDYHVKDSQVFVALPPVTGPDPGLLGILIERTRVADAIGGHGAALALKFDRELDEALKRHARAETRRVGFRILETDGDADYLLLPYVRLDLRPDGRAAPEFLLVVRYRNSAMGGDGTRKFRSVAAEARPLSAIGGEAGWADHDAALLKAAARRAFDDLALQFLRERNQHPSQAAGR